MTTPWMTKQRATRFGWLLSNKCVVSISIAAPWIVARCWIRTERWTPLLMTYGIMSDANKNLSHRFRMQSRVYVFAGKIYPTIFISNWNKFGKITRRPIYDRTKRKPRTELKLFSFILRCPVNQKNVIQENHTQLDATDARRESSKKGTFVRITNHFTVWWKSSRICQLWICLRWKNHIDDSSRWPTTLSKVNIFIITSITSKSDNLE